MRTKRLAFWGAVAGVSIVAPFLLEVAADKIPSEGFRRFVAFTHRGPGGQN